jgi:hypothetical protein
VLERSSEPIESPTNHRVDSPPTRIGEQAIKSWPSVFRARYAFIDVLSRSPTPRRHVAPKLGELILGFLIERADARIDRGPHRETPSATRVQRREILGMSEPSCWSRVPVEWREPLDLLTQVDG